MIFGGACLKKKHCKSDVLDEWWYKLMRGHDRLQMSMTHDDCCWTLITTDINWSLFCWYADIYRFLRSILICVVSGSWFWWELVVGGDAYYVSKTVGATEHDGCARHVFRGKWNDMIKPNHINDDCDLEDHLPKTITGKYGWQWFHFGFDLPFFFQVC